MKKMISNFCGQKNWKLVSVLFLFFTNIYLIQTFKGNAFLCSAFVIFSLYYSFLKTSKFFAIFFWLIVTSFYSLNLYLNFYSTGNHLFVALYISIVFLIQNFFPNESEITIKNSKYLLFLILFLSAIQKVFSSDYMSGEIMNFYFLSGYFFKPFEVFEGYKSYINQNETVINSILFANSQPQKISLFFANQKSIFTLFGFIVITTEFILSLLLFSKKRIYTNLFFILFLILLLITRMESGFIILLSILMLNIIAFQKNILKKIYIGIIILNLILIISGIGFH